MEQEIRFYKGLAKQYPNVASAATEIINLQAILNLPKGQSILSPMCMANICNSVTSCVMHPGRSEERSMMYSDRHCAWKKKRNWQRLSIIRGKS